MTTAIGDKVSDFELTAHNGDTVKLSEALKDGPVVLAFFPLAFTGVCTDELCEIRDSLKEFENLKATVFGVSVDSRFALAAYAEQQNLNFSLLSDFNKEVAGQFGVLYEEFLGLKGVSKRSVFVINPNLSVCYKWVTDNAKERPDFSEVRQALANCS